MKSTAIRLKWKSPVANKTISYYTIRYNPVGNISSDNASWVNYIRSNNEEVCITDLRPYTQYEFSVSSHVLNHSQGSYSDKVKCKTLEDGNYYTE